MSATAIILGLGAIVGMTVAYLLLLYFDPFHVQAKNQGEEPVVGEHQAEEAREGEYVVVSRPAGNLIAPRSGHLSIKLRDGRILVTGGLNENTWVTSFEIFDPETESFSLLREVQLEGSRSQVTQLADGRVVYGGSGRSRENLMFLGLSVDPPQASNSATETITQHHSSFTFTPLQDGRLLIAGNSASPGDREVEIYDPIKDEFNAAQNLLSSRFGLHTATLRRDGTVLIVGGKGTGSRRAEIYVPDGTTIPSGILGRQRRNHTATLLADGNPGNVAVIGGLANASEGGMGSGDTPLGFVEIHDAHTGYFDRIDDVLEVPRFDHTATLLPDGTVLIVGGFTRSGRWNNSTDIVERFHPRRQELEIVGRLHTSRGKHSAELLDDGSVLIVGGVRWLNGETTFLNSVEVLGPV